MLYDVAIVGGGPGGATCATLCAEHGLRALVLEREQFPREKVCGDCLNPGCWTILQRLGLDQRLRELPHARIACVDFIDRHNCQLRVALPANGNAGIAIKRSIFDQLLLERARAAGAEIHEQETLIAITKLDHEWKLTTNRKQNFRARILVAADGRNSTVARLLGLFPRVTKDRVGLQAHVPSPTRFNQCVVLQFLPAGYSGQAPVNDAELNVCLVGKAPALPDLRKWAAATFQLPANQSWRTITPLTRSRIAAAGQDFFAVGDAARVMEPFTGEGIFYALKSGELAAEMIQRRLSGADARVVEQDYRRQHSAMYCGRGWINAVARAAVIRPQLGSFFFKVARGQPNLLRKLTSKISDVSPG